jgi:hypothetical protein
LYIKAYAGTIEIVETTDMTAPGEKGYNIPTTDITKDTPLKVELYNYDAKTGFSTLLVRQVITTLEDGAAGADGESAYRIDIENDFVTIPSDFNGKIQLEEAIIEEFTTHIISLYYGSEVVKPN